MVFPNLTFVRLRKSPPSERSLNTFLLKSTCEQMLIFTSYDIAPGALGVMSTPEICILAFLEFLSK